MHALLLATVLALGSNTGRDGSNDVGMVDTTPGYTKLRPEMKYEEVCRVLGKPRAVIRSDTKVTYVWNGGRDEFGKVYTIVRSFDENARQTFEGMHIDSSNVKK
jgi:hypothetical protein